MRPFAPIRAETQDKVLARDGYRSVRCGASMVSIGGRIIANSDGGNYAGTLATQRPSGRRLR